MSRQSIARAGRLGLRFDHVASEPHAVNAEIRFGKPCVRGTRITVGEVLGYLAGGGSEAELLAAPEPVGLHPKAAKAMRDGLRSQLEDLEAELAEYDALRQGQVATLEAESIVGIGAALIKARIVRNLTQRELAERLSLAEQQIQRYETTQYRGVAAERLQQVADALNLSVREVFTLEQI